MVEQGPRHRGPPEGLRWEEHTQRSTVHNSDGQDTCVPHAKWMPALETVLWRDQNWCILLQSSTQLIQRHAEGLSEVLRHQSWLLGGKCARPLQLAHPCPLWNVNLWFEVQSCWGHAGTWLTEKQSKHHLPPWPVSRTTLSSLQLTLQGEDRSDQPSPHTHPKSSDTWSRGRLHLWRTNNYRQFMY